MNHKRERYEGRVGMSGELFTVYKYMMERGLTYQCPQCPTCGKPLETKYNFDESKGDGRFIVAHSTDLICTACGYTKKVKV